MRPRSRPSCLAVLLAILTFAAGCQPVKKVDLDRARVPAEPTILLLSIKPAEYPDYYDMNPLTMQFGLIGGTMQAVSNGNRQKSLDAMLREQRVDLTARLESAIAERLQAKGYAVRLVEVDRPDREKLLKPKAYRQYAGEPWAVLDVAVPFLGYWNQREPFRRHEPCLRALVRLVDPDSGEVLYGRALAFGGDKLPGDHAHLECEEALTFAGFEDLEREPQMAAHRLATAIDRTADYVAGALDPAADVASSPRAGEARK